MASTAAAGGVASLAGRLGDDSLETGVGEAGADGAQQFQGRLPGTVFRSSRQVSKGQRTKQYAQALQRLKEGLEIKADQ